MTYFRSGLTLLNFIVASGLCACSSSNLGIPADDVGTDSGGASDGAASDSSGATDSATTSIDGALKDSPSGRICNSVADCSASEDCIFATSGCRTTGVCEARLGCGRPSAPYCGCSGATFYDTCEGPGQAWVSTGACPSDGGVDSGSCSTSTCSGGLDCCGTSCVNLQNDPLNCHKCGARCTGATPMCSGGTCIAATCAPSCGDGKVCCEVNGSGPSRGPSCYPGPSCPVGCPFCK